MMGDSTIRQRDAGTTRQTEAALLAAEGLTPAWLTDALRAGAIIRRARVVSAEVEPISRRKGFVGRLFRVRLQYDIEEEGAPAALVAKLAARPGAIRDIAVRFRLYEREARFYQELAHRVEVRTPRLYHAVASPGSATYALLLEDMCPAVEGDPLTGCTLEQAEMLIGCLARMHAAWWNSPELDQLPWLPLPNDEVTLQTADAFFGAAWQAFLRNLDHEVSQPIVALGERLKHDRSVLDRLAAPPRTLVHGDLRVSNLMFANDAAKKLRAVVDWQTVGQCRGAMDVASLFVNNLQPEERRLAEAELLPRYWRALQENGVRGYSFDDCWLDYRLAVVDQFGQGVVLSSLLYVDGQQDEELGRVTGNRLLTAVLDLDLVDLLPPVSGWARWLPLLRRFRPLTRLS